MKLEQGRIHKDYQFEQFKLYKGWTTYEKPYRYIPKQTKGTRVASVVKSYSFRTITHPAFDIIYKLFIINGKKCYTEGLITNHLTSVGLSFWVRDDGAQQKNNEMIICSMGFSEEENIQMAKELNRKFSLHCKVVKQKSYWAIYIPASDAPTLRKHLRYLPDSMTYKMPKDKSKKNTSKTLLFVDLFNKKQHRVDDIV